ncbi:hypothetical protein [Salipaludibacillus sp. CF4.18]|uniref:hypothetical protein n=1 Tax=Salipaludibacillus sp. CF4.18 TaxID=3373081 RepID=UPI003EE519BF
MDKERDTEENDKKVAPTLDEEDSYGEDATQSDIDHGDSTKVTRLINDEVDPS